MGRRVTVRGEVKDTGNAHTFGLAYLAHAHLQDVGIEVNIDADAGALYAAKIRDYQAVYGECEIHSESPGARDGAIGLCLVQLMDFDGDGKSDLLLAYRDAQKASGEGLLDPEAYTVEAWTCRNGSLKLLEQTGVRQTHSGASYILLGESERVFSIADDTGPLGKVDCLYHYQLSLSHNPAMGDGYWSDTADVSFSYEDMPALTRDAISACSS